MTCAVYRHGRPQLIYVASLRLILDWPARCVLQLTLGQAQSRGGIEQVAPSIEGLTVHQ
jgi:hypothetical protein